MTDPRPAAAALLLAALVALGASPAAAQTPAAPGQQPCLHDPDLSRFPDANGPDNIRGAGVTWRDTPDLPRGEATYAGLIDYFPFMAVVRSCDLLSIVVTLDVPNSANAQARPVLARLLKGFNLPVPEPTLTDEEWATLTTRGSVSLGDERIIQDYAYNSEPGMAVITYQYWVDGVAGEK